MVSEMEVISRTCRLSGRVDGDMQCHCGAEGEERTLVFGAGTGIVNWFTWNR
jgi:hypothetical protein